VWPPLFSSFLVVDRYSGLDRNMEASKRRAITPEASIFPQEIVGKSVLPNQPHWWHCQTPRYYRKKVSGAGPPGLISRWRRCGKDPFNLLNKLGPDSARQWLRLRSHPRGHAYRMQESREQASDERFWRNKPRTERQEGLA